MNNHTTESSTSSVHRHIPSWISKAIDHCRATSRLKDHDEKLRNTVCDEVLSSIGEALSAEADSIRQGFVEKINMAQAGVGEQAKGYVKGWNNCVDEFARNFTASADVVSLEAAALRLMVEMGIGIDYEMQDGWFRVKARGQRLSGFHQYGPDALAAVVSAIHIEARNAGYTPICPNTESAAASTGDIDAKVEAAARAMAKHAGWEKWDTATDFTHTPAGNDPEDERDYWRELASIALGLASHQVIPVNKNGDAIKGEDA
jgi:hypothetical protein